MRLLPDFTYEGHTISLQDPVVMDGELVTRCTYLSADFFNSQSSIIKLRLLKNIQIVQMMKTLSIIMILEIIIV